LARSIKKHGHHRQFFFLIGRILKIFSSETKLTDDRRQTPSDGKSSLCLWQGELKIGQSETRIGYGGHVSKRIGTK
jgi:hypothetical protein